MNETNIAKLNISIGLKVDNKTAYMCLRLLEAYLDENENETLCIFCDECGSWDLSIMNRNAMKTKRKEQE